MLSVAKTQGTFYAYRCKNPRDFSCLVLQKPKGLYTMYNLQGTMYNFLTLRSQVVTANEKNRFSEKPNVQS